MAAVLAPLREHDDRVVLDAPEVAGSPAAAELARAADAAVRVVRGVVHGPVSLHRESRGGTD